MARLSAIESSGNTLGICSLRATPRLLTRCEASPTMSDPPKPIRPDAAASSPLTTLNIDVLPAPFGPITQKMPACSKSSERRSRMVTSPTWTPMPSIVSRAGGLSVGLFGAVSAGRLVRGFKRRANGSAKPAIPFGNTKTMAIKNNAINTSQNGKVSRSCAVKEPTTSVPITGPSKLARPPTAAQMTRSAERPNPTT